MEKLLNTKQLAEYFGVSESTIVQYRLNGIGPKYIKIGHLVRYRKIDADAWIEKQAVVIP